jgi:hypothetical protein
VDERDIAADRKALAELNWGGWYEPLHLASFAEKALPHYIARAEEAESALAHERRKVEAAIEELRYRPCPERKKARTRACEDAKYAHLKSYDALCPKCWSDYLDQKAKEGEGK